MEELLTVKEAAEALRLKPSTIYAYAEKGILPYTKLGNRLLFQKSRLEEWVEANSHPGRSLSAEEAMGRGRFDG